MASPIIRVSPYELHVIDPAFFEKLYRQDGRWDKYEWTYAGFGALGSSIGTASHESHKARRQPLNPFFSKAKVAARHDIVERDVYKLCDRVAQFAARGNIVNLGTSSSALTRDVACEFVLNKKYDFLGREDFDIGMTNALQAGGHIWRITKHVPWFGPAMKSIPPNLLMKVADEGTKGFFRFLQEHERDTKDLLVAAAATSPNDEAPRTIVHEIMDSDLPEADKSFKRVLSVPFLFLCITQNTRSVSRRWGTLSIEAMRPTSTDHSNEEMASDDVATVTGAGFETTASVMRRVLYHVYSNPEILRRLRAELDEATSKPPGKTDVKTLEQLPYLTSLIMEDMRLSPAIGSRMARIAPDRDLFYGDLRIPAGIPVGMTTILMHTDESLYPEPLCFDPERWTDVDARKSKDKTLGWAMLYMTLAELVQRFDIDFVDAVATDFEMESD
ncbi:hypothetical protein N0V82_010180 [Gnomoniopsis sp. IMI 355080]|nr:hypothetical protein N0V82_010180 [Gnomoniopsis sp. IMI 355080]